MVERLTGQQWAAAMDQRDRELEDFLRRLTLLVEGGITLNFPLGSFTPDIRNIPVSTVTGSFQVLPGGRWYSVNATFTGDATGQVQFHLPAGHPAATVESVGTGRIRIGGAGNWDNVSCNFGAGNAFGVFFAPGSNLATGAGFVNGDSLVFSIFIPNNEDITLEAS